MPAFRIDSKQFFLTYAQANEIDIADLYRYFENWVQDESNKPTKILVAEESHGDGGKHFHVYLKFPKKINIRQPNYFEFRGYHPNTQGVRSSNAVIKYCTKEGNFKANFDFKIKGLSIEEIIKKSNTSDEFLTLMEQHQAGTLVRSFANTRAFSDYRWNATSPAFDAVRNLDTDFRYIPTDCQIWHMDLLDHVKGQRDMKSMWLHGPTRLGKTQLARSFGRHCYIANTWCVEQICDDAQYLIIDDVDWDSWKWQYKSLLGLQYDVIFTGKYKRPKKFLFGMPAIVLSNELPYFPPEVKEWIDKNVIFVEINMKLY